MLSRLSIRDIVLIERLDIDYAAGLSVLPGETGAGKSILLDAFALALGSRGDASLVRNGAEQGQVTAAFDVEADHPALALIADNGVASEDGLILRRVQLADGRTRAFVNDEPVSVQVLRSLGSALVEIHGQHDDRALVDVASHRQLLDAYAGLEADAAAVARLWAERRTAEEAVASHRARVEQARREADWLRHAVEELTRLKPETGEESALAEKRTAMMQFDKIAEDLRDAHDAVAGDKSPISALSAAMRPANHDPRELDRIEERLFALRAAGRKYNVPVDNLAALNARHASDLAALDAGEKDLGRLEKAAREAEANYRKNAE